MIMNLDILNYIFGFGFSLVMFYKEYKVERKMVIIKRQCGYIVDFNNLFLESIFLLIIDDFGKDFYEKDGGVYYFFFLVV